jgi:hypothetical protein
MPRVARIAPGDVIFHVLNRGNARSQIFEKDSDYKAFERILIETTPTTVNDNPCATLALIQA